jgi:hypothetical protein
MIVATAIVGVIAVERGSPFSSSPQTDPPRTGERFHGEGRALFEDLAIDPDPVTRWGSLECAHGSRHVWVATGGDEAGRGGRRPVEGGFRRLRVLDGDDFFGERCELGENDHLAGPTALYREGQRRITHVSIRLPAHFPLDASSWQVVMQMKQSQPSAGGGSPILALHAYAGRWRLQHDGLVASSRSDGELWSAPARVGIWIRFEFDVLYSQDEHRGWLRLRADLNGDDDMLDPNERPTQMRLQTLKREPAVSEGEGVPAGKSIPSHLRVGLYHDPAIECPRPRGCQIDVDSVRVYAG